MQHTFTPDKTNALVNLSLLIVEDSISYAIELEQLSEEIGFDVLASVDNSADALDIIFSEAPDIILMDINIKGRLTGIDIAKKIIHLDIPVLYITSFSDEETYNKAQESNLIGYIVKPVDKLTLATSLKLLMQRRLLDNINDNEPKIFRQEDNEYIFFIKNKVYQKVDLNEILYVKSEDNYCHFVLTDNTTYLLRIKISEAEDLLKERKFIRCHRQYIVNQRKIQSLNTEMSTIKLGNLEIPFSRSKKSEIMSIGIFIR